MAYRHAFWIGPSDGAPRGNGDGCEVRGGNASAPDLIRTDTTASAWPR